MAIFKLNNLSEEEKKKYYNNLQNKIDNDFEGEKQRAIDINQASTIQNNQQVNNVPSQQNNNSSIWDKMQWLTKRYINSAQLGVTNTIGSVPQSMAVGYNRAEKQAEKEQNTLDHIYNIGKNGIKVLANDPASRFLYNLTLGRDDYIDRLKEQATQLNDNFNDAEGILKKASAVIAGVTSNIATENNTAVQQAYDIAQLNGSINGKDYSDKQKEKMLELDENINKDAEKWSEELEKEGENYDEFTKFLGNATGSIGYMTPSIVLTALTGGGSGAQALGMAQMGLSAKGQATRQGLKEGLDIESADRKGVASGSAEVGSEFMFNGLKAFKTFRKNGVEEVARNWIEKQIEKRVQSELGQKVTKGIGNWLVDITGESIEELTTDIYNTWLDRATTDPNKEYTLHDALNTILSTALSTTGINAGNKVMNTALNNKEQYRDYNTGEVLNKDTQRVLNQAKDIIDGKTNQQEYKKIVEENIKSQPQSTQNEQTLPTQQINQGQNKVAQNGNMEQILPTQNTVKEDNLKGRSFEDIVDDAMNNYEYEEVKSPLQNRDINTIGKDTKTNAYQYDNPKVKPYFQQMAEMIGEDIGNIASPDNRKTQKGGGTALNTNIPAIKQLKEMGYSYDQIIDGIVNIIDDHGKENNALSKKLEIIIDDQLRNGYTNSYGKYISPNQEYINLISKDNVQNNQILPTVKENLPVQESKQALSKRFQEITGDSIARADAKLAGMEMRNLQRQNGKLAGEIESNPYSKEAMDIYNKYNNSKQSSKYLYHSTSADNLQSILENGLTTGNKQNQEGISSKNKIYLSATEELAQSFAPQDNITLRINPNAKLENIESDLLGGEGSYAITNNIPANMLQIKENGKWVNLENSNIAKQLQKNTAVKLDNFVNNQNSIEKNQNKVEKNVGNSKIEEKINNYIENIKDNFITNIDIKSNVVQENNESPINYKVQTEATIFKKAKDIFNTLQKKVFKNGDTDIHVDNADIKESIHHTLKDDTQKKLLNENLAVYSQLDKVIENAIQISEDSENKGRNKFSDWKYYASNVNIDGKPYVVEFDTTMKDGERHFRLERVYKMNKADVATDSSNNMTPRFEYNICFY